MDQDRFSNLSMINIERDKKVDPEEILQKFISINKRKMNLEQCYNNFCNIYYTTISKCWYFCDV